MNLKNFTPCLDILTKEKGRDFSFLFGVMWRLAQGRDRMCRASMRTLNEMTGIDIDRIRNMQAEMCEMKLLRRLTEAGMRNRPQMFEVVDIAMVSNLEMVPENSDLLSGSQHSWSGFSAQLVAGNSDEETIETKRKKEKGSFEDLLKTLVGEEQVEEADKANNCLLLLEKGLVLNLGRGKQAEALGRFLRDEEEKGFKVEDFVAWMQTKISDKFDPTEHWNGKNCFEKVTGSYWPKFKHENDTKTSPTKYHGRVA